MKEIESIYYSLVRSIDSLERESFIIKKIGVFS